MGDAPGSGTPLSPRCRPQIHPPRHPEEAGARLRRQHENKGCGAEQQGQVVFKNTSHPDDLSAGRSCQLLMQIRLGA